MTTPTRTERHLTKDALKASRMLLISLGTLALIGCSGSGVPTPPGLINSQNQDSQPLPQDQQAQSIMATIPPDGTQQPASDTGLPPASSLGTISQSAAPNSTNQPPRSRLVNPYKAPASNAVLTFEPMVGAPTNVARQLSTSLGQRVAQQALPVVARSDTKVTHRIKGYFSASESQGQCVVSYVWDIFDKDGTRLNRITGSKKTAMTGSDPWDAVTAPILDQVAIDTAAQLKTWHSSL